MIDQFDKIKTCRFINGYLVRLRKRRDGTIYTTVEMSKEDLGLHKIDIELINNKNKPILKINGEVFE